MKAALLTLASMALLLGACKVEKSPGEQAAQPAPQAPSAAAPAAPPPAAEVPGAATTFDIGTVPISAAALGDFPFMTLPDGYQANGGKTLDYARFPFWYGNTTHWVEGKFYQAGLKPAPGKDFSWFELKKNFETLIQQIGGVQVAEGKLPYDVMKSWGSEITSGFYTGLGGGYEPQAVIWAVHRNDGNIWVQLTEGNQAAGYVVGQEKAFVATARLLKASELKQQIDTTGKVDLQVNFATDKTEILPDSMPQIDQVVQLLQDDPQLKLAINGHTDSSGEHAHNQTLSEGRAASVMRTLVERGVAASRLHAAGYGDTRPVADNGSEEGKARNRRVELVRQ